MNKELPIYTLFKSDDKRKGFQNPQSLHDFVNDTATLALSCSKIELKNTEIRNAIFFFLNTLTSSFNLTKDEHKRTRSDFNVEAFFDLFNNSSSINEYLKSQITSLNLKSKQAEIIHSLAETDGWKFEESMRMKIRLDRKIDEIYSKSWRISDYYLLKELNHEYSLNRYLNDLERIEDCAKKRAKRNSTSREFELNKLTTELHEKIKTSTNYSTFDISTDNFFLFPISQNEKVVFAEKILGQITFLRDKMLVNDNEHPFTIRDAVKSSIYINLFFLLTYHHVRNSDRNAFLQNSTSKSCVASNLAIINRMLGKKELKARYLNLINISSSLINELLKLDFIYSEIMMVAIKQRQSLLAPLNNKIKRINKYYPKFNNLIMGFKDQFKINISSEFLEKIEINTDVVLDTINHKKVK